MRIRLAARFSAGRLLAASLVTATLLIAPALAQNAATSPSLPPETNPAPAATTNQNPGSQNSGGQDLDTTLKFIANIMEQQGTVDFIANWEKSSGGARGFSEFTEDLRSTTYDASTCGVHYIWKLRLNGKAKRMEGPFALKDVKKVQLMGEVQSLNFDGTSEKTVTSTSPQITEVWLTLGDGQVRQFWFVSAADAGRVARAFTRAVELCGGG